MKFLIKIYGFILFHILGFISIKAQQNSPISYQEFMNLVAEKNLSYAALKYNVSIAEAAIQTASMFPDPQLGIDGSNNGIFREMGYTFGGNISWTLELGGKRKARVDLSKNQSELSKILLKDYFRNLRADVSESFIDAISAKLLLKVQQDSYENMLKLAKSDSIRYKLGNISLVTSKQSKLEAASLKNDVFQAESKVQQSINELSKYWDNSNTPNDVAGNFNNFNRDFKLEDLITQALNVRADLAASKQNIVVAKSQIKLESANRKIDLGLSLGISHNTTATNEIAPSPAVNATQLGLSIPLKFSNKRNADLKIAEMIASQTELEYQQAEQNIRAEVMQAFHEYSASQKQLKQYQNGMLSDAKIILDGIIYSYKRGESSILEVLNAQRTYNDVQQSYFQLLSDNAKALVDLERKVGIWDIDM
ncbi:TolC family protein [Epilithonimonas hominis]|uniref:TolC family protein n=1 Tax=Epilithonimonas hominis TaxID=420404 RepID=UPI0028A14111|nr:TolC family protein [Epilithonimonas hominis]